MAKSEINSNVSAYCEDWYFFNAYIPLNTVYVHKISLKIDYNQKLITFKASLSKITKSVNQVFQKILGFFL